MCRYPELQTNLFFWRDENDSVIITCPPPTCMLFSISLIIANFRNAGWSFTVEVVGVIVWKFCFSIFVTKLTLNLVSLTRSCSWQICVVTFGGRGQRLIGIDSICNSLQGLQLWITVQLNTVRCLCFDVSLGYILSW